MVPRALFLLACLAACQAFLGSGDDQYMKKFAYRKVYESCFGMAVVRQIRREKQDAIAKCRRQTGPVATPTVASGTRVPTSDSPEPRPEASPTVGAVNHFPSKKRPSVHVPAQGGPLLDPTKLQELFGLKSQSGYIQATQQQHQSPSPQAHQSYHPFGYPGGHFTHQTPHFPQQYPQQYLGQQYLGQQYSGQQFPGQQFSGQQFSSQQYPSQYQAGQNDRISSVINPYTAALNAFYPQQGYSYPQAIYAQSSFFPFGMYDNTRKRVSRNMNIQNQLDSLNRAIGAKAENVSCHLQELGYLDDNLEPDYKQIAERVQRLPIEEELKRDMMDGLEFCKRFSQCMPDMRKEDSKMPRDQDKQMFFFSCYKHKKLEACLMKDVRERFMTDDPLTGEELTVDDLRSLPRARKAKMPKFQPEEVYEKDDDDDVYFV